MTRTPNKDGEAGGMEAGALLRWSAGNPAGAAVASPMAASEPDRLAF